jgi:hypothetical protein
LDVRQRKKIWIFLYSITETSEGAAVKFDALTIRPSREHLFGASSAQSDLMTLYDIIQGQTNREIVVCFDFSEADSVSGSYIRATLGWCLQCGRMFAEGSDRVDFADPWSIRPLPIYPVVTGGSREILFDVHDFLQHREMCGLLIETGNSPPFVQAEILGKLDLFLLDTLKSIALLGSATAQDLKALSSEAITIGGWSNRLVALLSHRLVSRRRDGKSWRYSAIGKEFRIWA